MTRLVPIARMRRSADYLERCLADPEGWDATHPIERAIHARRLAELQTELRRHCSICGRLLTDPESLARGIGPECARKLVSA